MISMPIARLHGGWSLHGHCTVQSSTGIDPWDGLHGALFDVVWRLDKPKHRAIYGLHGCVVRNNRAAQCNARIARCSCGLLIVCKRRVEVRFGVGGGVDLVGLDAPDRARCDAPIGVGCFADDALNSLELERARRSIDARFDGVLCGDVSPIGELFDEVLLGDAVVVLDNLDDRFNELVFDCLLINFLEYDAAGSVDGDEV